MSALLYDGLVALFAALVVVATIPVVTGALQFLALAFSVFATHLEKCAPYCPRVAILIPAWNEESVIEVTIDRLMKLDYPKDRLRIYVIDDASSDRTPEMVIAKSKRWPKNVIHVRRVAGGEGKAHTLNYGLDVLWKSEWAQAILIMDADVIYTETSLLRMARHLVDPNIGAVTAYIKEGSRAPTYVQRFVTFEYITATGASRRAQNVFGFLACLSGGAQLHSRENLFAIGGKIFDDTLAEDTFTTFNTQLEGRMAIFEPNAIVYAEEPHDLQMLWKQRLRWARGNVQITDVFRDLWGRRSRGSLGSFTMAAMWFSIFLMPVFQISASVSLISLSFMDAGFAWKLFEGYWIIAAIVYLLVTFASFVIDTESAKKSWIEGFAFPGLISLSIIAYSIAPSLFEPIAEWVALAPGGIGERLLMLFLYAWLSLAMVFAWLAAWLEGKVEDHPRLQWVPQVVLYIAGYGAFLCAVTFAAYIKEFKGEARTWDKTEKKGAMSA